MKNYSTIIAENRAWAEEIFNKLNEKMSCVAVRSRNKLPDGVDENGIHIDRYTKNRRNWTSGFFGSMNALLYKATGNEEYLKTLKASAEMLDDTLSEFKNLDHDVGFVYHLVFKPLFDITSEERYKNSNLFAAASLSSRFVMGANFIRAWNPWRPGDESAHNWSIIDCLMNLPLLYWASNVTNDDRFKRVAMAHADMALRAHLRPDGSIAHIVEHDRESGEVVKTYGGQGIAEGSSWSRGQSWGLYGFTLSYIHTGEERYLNAAKQVANYFIANVCDDWLPRVDFRAPGEPVYYDSTAGMCAACGLLELAKRLPEHEGGMYAHAAVNMLRAMTEKFANFNPQTDDMIGYGTIRYPANSVINADPGLHISIIYADMFYTEAILKLLGNDYSPW